MYARPTPRANPSPVNDRRTRRYARATVRTATALLVLGVTAEIVGVMLVAAPDYVPHLVQLARAVRGRTVPLVRRFAAFVRRLFRRPRHLTISAEPATLRLTGSIRGVVSVRDGASIDEKVDYLLRREQHAQEQFDAIDRRISAQPAQWRSELEAMRAEIETTIDSRLTESERRYIRARQIGLLFLIVGLSLTTAANLA